MQAKAFWYEQRLCLSCILLNLVIPTCCHSVLQSCSWPMICRPPSAEMLVEAGPNKTLFKTQL
jgi:hypothetical protein